jgi:uncharacterized protein YacL
MVFAAVFATGGFLLGRDVYEHLVSLHVESAVWQLALTILVPVAGAVGGVFLAPMAQALFETELGEAEGAIDRLTTAEIIGGAIGLVLGLVVAWLVKNILLETLAGAGRFGGYVGIALSILFGLFAAYLGARVGAKQRIEAMVPRAPSDASGAATMKIIDTSVIVDGRIVQIAESGFLDGPLVLPRFVLRELQTIADSADPSKRTRGRHGLEALAKLQEVMAMEIDERDFNDAGGVDAKLVRLARERNAKILTNDFNLNRVAQVEGVGVLSVNELAGAIKPIVLPGEELHIAVIRDGKEPNQGVGYLDDGTMVVVENGRRFLGEDLDVQVTSVLQTVAGRMIFARPKRG